MGERLRCHPIWPLFLPVRAFYNEEENLKKIFNYYEFREGGHYTYSEDCLFLNIFAPEFSGEGSRLQVLFYIHDGRFVVGTGAQFLVEGKEKRISYIWQVPPVRT